MSVFRSQAEKFRKEEMTWARRHLIRVEKQEIIDAYHRGLFSQDAYERLLADIDARLLQLESGEVPSEKDRDQ